MKLLSLLAVAVLGFFLFSPSLLLAESVALIEIQTINHSVVSEAEEKITFALDAEVPVRLFALKGEKPRLVMDFPNSIYRGKNVIVLEDGDLARKVRIGLHNEPNSKARIVIDFSTTFAVDYKHSFLESENLLEVVLTRGEAIEGVVAENEIVPPVEEVLPDNEKKQVAEMAVVATPVEKEGAAEDQKTIPATADTKVEPPAKVDDSEDVPLGLPQLLEVSFDDSSNRGEMVLFHLNDFFPPTVSAIEKNNPRVLCDFKNMRLSKDVQTKIDANGKYVEGIRTAYHEDKDKVRVVLDLSPDRDYDLQQVFFKNDNLFVLIVNELPIEKTAN